MAPVSTRICSITNYFVSAIGW